MCNINDRKTELDLDIEGKAPDAHMGRVRETSNFIKLLSLNI